MFGKGQKDSQDVADGSSEALTGRMGEAFKRFVKARLFGSPQPGRSRLWQNGLAAFLVLAALISGIATYAALTETPPLGNDPDTVIRLLNVDLVILLLLGSLVARRIVGLWSGRKRGLAGSHLHVRLVYIFSVLAAVPAIVMTVFSLFFFHFGVQTWFSQRVQTAVERSHAVAEAYLEEHQQLIRADILAMANDLNRQAHILLTNENAFSQFIQTQSALRNLSEAIVFDSDGRILARSSLTFSLEFEEISYYAMQQADEGEIVIMTGGADDRVRALMKLDNFIDSYLFVGRMVDPQVLSHLEATQRAAQDYASLQSRYSGLQITMTMIFIIVALLLLFAAIWFGFVLARQIVSPISTLITTVDRVRAGDLSARVPEEKTLQEFDYLAQAFNRMTRQIQEQQSQLIQTNRQLDERRRFTETVLAGVTSGVIGVDQAGKIHIANAAAAELLKQDDKALAGRDIRDLIPEIVPLLEQAHKRTGKITQAEIPLAAAPGTEQRVFLVRIVIERIGEKDTGAILTFDDITDLQSAQRKAAWADVARRIAHEIKNPLTPIQLSAERLRKKYLKQIDDDPETFSQCTDTIIRHVEDIGKMVDEFSSFARMPEPVMRYENLNVQIKEALTLHVQAHPDITFSESGFDEQVFMACFDQRQIRQALSNLIRNALDSIKARQEEERTAGNEPRAGRIDISLLPYGADEVAIAVRDNGQGLPKEEAPSRLMEPYVTHKKKGTGLGLAIVKKIMEDHHGALVPGAPEWLKVPERWEKEGGATMVLILPAESTVSEKAPESARGAA
ncbi:MAG: PAS domain-containing sensor histidine kinase [Alphaproteobacteria bacterium]